MTKDECYLAGKIIRTHGVKGDVMIFLDVDDPQRYKKMKTLFADTHGQFASYEVVKVSLNSNIATVHLKGIEDMTRAEDLVKSDVYLPLSFLPKLDDTRFYFHEVINFKVVDEGKGEIGIFEKVIDSTHQTIAQIRNGDKEILAPMIKEFIVRVDRNEKILYLRLPEGLVDLYMSATSSNKDMNE